MTASRIGCTIDLGGAGRAWGRLTVPYSQHRSAYGHIPIPIARVRGGDGPTILITGGVHGDEYDGQIEIARLVNTLDPAVLRGRILAVPSTNLPAALAGSRTSPIDAGNLARLFPGERDGTVTKMIAHYVETELVSQCDFVLDIHAGGSSLDYLPCTLARDKGAGSDADTRAALAAFGAPYAAVVHAGRQRDGTVSPGDDRTLLAAAARKGARSIAAEMGGAGTVRPSSLAITRRGLRNMLVHWGLLGPEHADPAPARAVEVAPQQHVFAPCRGVFAPDFDLGDDLVADSIVGHVHDLEQPERPAVPVIAPAGGIVLARRVPALVEPGDCLAQLCSPV